MYWRFRIWFEKVKLYAKHIGKSPEEIESDIRRPKYFSPSEAVEYGIIDKVHSPSGVIISLRPKIVVITLLFTIWRLSTMRGLVKTEEFYRILRRHNWYRLSSHSGWITRYFDITHELKIILHYEMLERSVWRRFYRICPKITGASFTGVMRKRCYQSCQQSHCS